MLVTKEIEIDMGHRVPNHKSKCKSAHGHRYKIEVGVNDKVITKAYDSSEGMVIDFGDLKAIMIKVIDTQYDHAFTIWHKDPLLKALKADKNTKLNIVEFIPTAENLAKHWFLLLRHELEKVKIQIAHVKVWETPTSTAIYTVRNYVEDNPVQLDIALKDIAKIMNNKKFKSLYPTDFYINKYKKK